jgi:hypothetical protein
MLNIKPFHNNNQIIKTKKKLGAKEGDDITLINIFNMFYASRNKSQFCIQNNLSMEEMMKAMKLEKKLRESMIRGGLKI